MTLFTDEGSKARVGDVFDDVRIVPVDGTRIKQGLLWDSPYYGTLYLDSDTRIVNPIDDLFSLLGRFDIAAAIDPARKVAETASIYDEYKDIPEAFPEFAGGVILFRKSAAVERFFNIWDENYKRWCQLSGRVNDQPAFRVALWQCDNLRLYTLPPEYNLRTQEKRDKFRIRPRIFHWHDMHDLGLKRNPQAF